jgi:hypothetical protein
MDPELAAEGFTRLTYEIAEGHSGHSGVSKLTVIHEIEGKPGPAAVLSGGMGDVGAGGGWNWVLSDLKSLLGCLRRVRRWSIRAVVVRTKLNREKRVQQSRGATSAPPISRAAAHPAGKASQRGGG